MLKIRMQRLGKKSAPKYRIVLIDSQKGPKSANFVEILGHYDPGQKHLKLEEEKIKDRIEKGAQVSDTVYNMLVDEKLVDGPKRQVVPKKIREAPAKQTEETEEAEQKPEDQETKTDEDKEAVESKKESKSEEETKEDSESEEEKEDSVDQETPAEEEAEEGNDKEAETENKEESEEKEEDK